MNNPDMCELFQCTEEELAQLKATFKHQMETNIIRGQPFLEQLPSEVDADGFIRERMWGAVMTSDRSFLEMLTGRRWGGEKPADFNERVKLAKRKICHDFTEVSRKRRQKNQEIADDVFEEVDDIPVTDRRLRKRREISYDEQQIRVTGGEHEHRGLATSMPSKKKLQKRPNMFNGRRRPQAITDDEDDDEPMPMHIKQESPLFESDTPEAGLPTQTLQVSEPRRRVMARPSRLGLQPAPRDIYIPQTNGNDFGEGPALQHDSDDDGSDIVVASSPAPPARRGLISPSETESTHHRSATPPAHAMPSYAGRRHELATARPSRDTRTPLSTVSRVSPALSSIEPGIRPAKGTGLAGMTKKWVRLQVSEAEARIMVNVERQIREEMDGGREALKAEIREEVLEEIRREFEFQSYF